MEEQEIKRKSKIQFIIPIIVAIIVVGIFVYLEYRNKPSKPTPPNNNESLYKPKPVSPSENPLRSQPIPPEQLAQYGCAGPLQLEAETIKQPDSIWKIKKDASTTRVSLGKYRITAPEKLIFDIKKLWLYFFSEKISDRDDFIYAPESSYVSRILLLVNDFEKEINLGGDEYMLIELDYPLGDLYPYEQETTLEYEIIVELKCKNIENGKCLSNDGRPLDFVDNVDIQAVIRLFAVGCQEFEQETVVEAKFAY